MKLSKLDLGGVVAVAHANGQLQLLLNRGDELELLEIPAPVQAFEGLQQLNTIVASTTLLPESKQIDMFPVSSSMANALGYDSDSHILQVEFQSGAVYQYSGVEPEVWDELHSSDSIGGYFNDEIRGNYRYERIDNEDEYYC